MHVTEKAVRAVIGRNMRRLREQSELSAREVAARIQHSPSKVASFERGEAMPDYATLAGLAETFEVTVERIFDGLTIDALSDSARAEAARAGEEAAAPDRQDRPGGPRAGDDAQTQHGVENDA